MTLSSTVQALQYCDSYGAICLDAAKSEQWLCSTATAPNRKSENMFLAGGGDFAFLTHVYNSL
jgi:hypothetical protein